MTDTCVIQTCHILDPVMADGAMICDTCEATLVRMLGEIEDCLRIVNPFRLRRPAERGPVGFGPVSPANDDVIAALDPRSTVNGHLDPDEAESAAIRPVVGTIGSWAQLVIEEADTWVPSTLVEAVTLLRGRAGWLAQRPWIDEAYRELADVHRQLQAAVGDKPPKPLAKCIEFHKAPCEGPVFWSEKPRDEAQCARCKRIYAGLDLARLQSAQEAG